MAAENDAAFHPVAAFDGTKIVGASAMMSMALAGVIDFGTLGVGQPPAEHAPIWDLPRTARDSYRERLA